MDFLFGQNRLKCRNDLLKKKFSGLFFNNWFAVKWLALNFCEKIWAKWVFPDLLSPVRITDLYGFLAKSWCEKKLDNKFLAELFSAKLTKFSSFKKLILVNL